MIIVDHFEFKLDFIGAFRKSCSSGALCSQIHISAALCGVRYGSMRVNSQFGANGRQRERPNGKHQQVNQIVRANRVPHFSLWNICSTWMHRERVSIYSVYVSACLVFAGWQRNGKSAETLLFHLLWFQSLCTMWKKKK